MDIELSEPKALAGFTIERFKPELVCIEAHPEVPSRSSIISQSISMSSQQVSARRRQEPLFHPVTLTPAESINRNELPQGAHHDGSPATTISDVPKGSREANAYSPRNQT